VGAEPPAKLVAFRVTDWSASHAVRGSADWEDAFQLWKAARSEWIREHPDSTFATQRLELLRGERRARFGDLGMRESDVSRLRGM
jgi:hypothetical protein